MWRALEMKAAFAMESDTNKLFSPNCFALFLLPFDVLFTVKILIRNNDLFSLKRSHCDVPVTAALLSKKGSVDWEMKAKVSNYFIEDTFPVPMQP